MPLRNCEFFAGAEKELQGTTRQDSYRGSINGHRIAEAGAMSAGGKAAREDRAEAKKRFPKWCAYSSIALAGR